MSAVKDSLMRSGAKFLFAFLIPFIESISMYHLLDSAFSSVLSAES